MVVASAAGFLDLLILAPDGRARAKGPLLALATWSEVPGEGIFPPIIHALAGLQLGAAQGNVVQTIV